MSDYPASPVISVIIPTYNMEPWITDTIHSVLKQSFSNFECIIIDDGSTDNTVSTIQQIHDPRLHILQQTNQGVSAARNTGLSHAKGQYIAFLDGDDLWDPQFLQIMLNALQTSPGSKLSWCNTVMFMDVTYKKKPQPWGNIHKTGNIWWDFLQHTYFTMGAFLVETQLIKHIGIFDTTLLVGEDRDFILRILAYLYSKPSSFAQVVHIPIPLKFYRIHTRNSVKKYASQALQDEWYYMKKHIEHPIIPEHIKKKSYSNLAFKLAVIAAFGTKNISSALSWYTKAIKIHPWNLNLYLLPLKKCLLSLMPQLKVNIPKSLKTTYSDN